MPTTPSQSFIDKFKAWLLGNRTRLALNPLERDLQLQQAVKKFTGHHNRESNRMRRQVRLRARNRTRMRMQRRSRQINRRRAKGLPW